MEKVYSLLTKKLLNQIILSGESKRFDFCGSYPYVKMLKNQINKKNDSWAIRWYASAFLANSKVAGGKGCPAKS